MHAPCFPEIKSPQHKRNKRSMTDSPMAEQRYEVCLLELPGVFIVPEDYTARDTKMKVNS